MSTVEHAFFYSCIALVVLIWTGNWVCRLVLKMTGGKLDTPSPDPASNPGTPADADPNSTTETGDPKAGRMIGGLERVILAVGIILQSWEVLAAVIALKSVARFNKLNDKNFAEYFLVGSLASLLWAIVVTGGWIVYDQTQGADIRQTLLSLIGPPATPRS